MSPSTSRYFDVHQNSNGAGDARPTALQIIKDEGLEGKLTDKVALITGASAGIGVETARALHAAGVKLFLTVRDVKKGQKVVDDIQSEDPSNKAEITLLEISLDSLESVRAGARAFLSQSSQLNILIFNAGVMATPEGRTKDGFETQFGTNHLSHFLLFQLLKETLLASSTPSFNSRVVTVASFGHRMGPVRVDDYNFEKSPYEPWAAYGQAKTANIYLANTIDRRYGSQGLHALSLHPGGIKSNLQVHVKDSMDAMWDVPIVKKYTKSPAQGASTTVYAAVSKEWEGKGGRYLSDCREMEPVKSDDPMAIGDDGYAPWAYDPETEDKLWKDSLKMVGLGEEA